MPDIGSRIRQLRTEKGLKMKELAEMADISQSSLSYIENKANSPTVETLEAILKALGTTLADFFANDPDTLSQLQKPKYPRDFVKLIEQEEFILNGELATPEEKERLIQVYYLMFQDAKEKNKKARAAAKARKEENKE